MALQPAHSFAPAAAATALLSCALAIADAPAATAAEHTPQHTMQNVHQLLQPSHLNFSCLACFLSALSLLGV
jgi:hypothetical protein